MRLSFVVGKLISIVPPNAMGHDYLPLHHASRARPYAPPHFSHSAASTSKCNIMSRAGACTSGA
jgi:hypothetical protein